MKVSPPKTFQQCNVIDPTSISRESFSELTKAMALSDACKSLVRRVILLLLWYSPCSISCFNVDTLTKTTGFKKKTVKRTTKQLVKLLMILFLNLKNLDSDGILEKIRNSQRSRIMKYLSTGQHKPSKFLTIISNNILYM